MATIVQTGKPVVVDPLRHSAPLGAVLAFLGVERCMPLLHSSQGCAALAKVLLTRHFRETIPLQTSALTEVNTILGSGESLLTGIATVASRHQPDLVAVITTGLVDASGEDVRRTLRLRSAGPPVVLAAVSDLGGGLEQGYAVAVGAPMPGFPAPLPGARAPHRLPVPPGPAPSTCGGCPATPCCRSGARTPVNRVQPKLRTLCFRSTAPSGSTSRTGGERSAVSTLALDA